MIHVAEQEEPDSFDEQVRQKGLSWLDQHNIALNQPLPAKTEIKPYWRDCLDDLHRSYAGCCAYLAVYIERVMGGGSVDHFIAKSQRADLAYEWKNYRLACTVMNSRKREYDDVIDPFEVVTGWFHLEMVSGRIYPSPELDSESENKVRETIDRLGLDDPGNREMRARHYQEYRQEIYEADFLRRRSPFVWTEANRQGLL